MSEPIGVLTIIGAGRIGCLFADLAAAGGMSAIMLGRGDPMPRVSGPVLVCTRNDDLEAVLEHVPADRRRDLVFVQNGMLRPWLAKRGLQRSTQGVLYVAVRWIDDPPVAGAPSVFIGRWAQTVVGLLRGGGISARVGDDEQDFLREVGVKLAWICALGPLAGATGLTVGEVCERYLGEIEAICGEIGAVLAREPGVRIDPAWLTDRVVDYTRSIPNFKSAVKEWPWRNGWLTATAERLGLGLPVHDTWVDRNPGARAGGSRSPLNA